MVGAREGEPSHGFARISEWDLHETTALPDGGVTLRFSLPETAEGAIWPPFSANYVVRVTDTLELELIITNTAGDQQFGFESCLHTYFAVEDISAVSVIGLKGATYLDKAEGFARKTDSTEAIRINAETDRTYLDTSAVVEIIDPKLRRRIRVEKENSLSTVVWNPWAVKAQQMPDFGNEEYKRMICVESGNVGKNRTMLAPGRSSVLKVRLRSSSL